MSGDVTYVLADVIIFVYDVPCVFGIDEVSLITLKILLQGAMELVQIATAYFITKCDGQLLQIATAFSFIPKCDTVYCKLRQVLQSAMIITNCDRYYKVR